MRNNISIKSLPILFLFLTLNSISAYSQCLSGDCQNGIGLKIYPDSAKFEGVFEDGMRKKGKYIYASGDIYEGDFYKNLRHGFGVYNYKGGQLFRGIYKNDEKEYGIFRFKNGDQYIGTFVNNKPDGFGIMHFSDGRKLEGQWVDGKPQWSVSGDSLSFNNIQDTSLRDITELYSQKKLIPKMYAVVVGIADYEGTTSDLRYSDDDATLFYNHLKRAFPRELAAGGATLLIDSKGTKSAIQNALSIAFSKATENDYIIFFFSGHGGKGTFVPYDLNSNLLSHQEVKAAFKKSSAKFKLCIADACFAGSVGTENISTSNYDAAQDLRDARLAVLLSSNNQQTSSEMNQLGQGLFSYWLMNGLRGAADLNRDKYITAGELFVYTRNAVVKQSSGKQSPVVIGKNLDKIPLCRLR
jgi:hypothetical protein